MITFHRDKRAKTAGKPTTQGVESFAKPAHQRDIARRTALEHTKLNGVDRGVDPYEFDAGDASDDGGGALHASGIPGTGKACRAVGRHGMQRRAAARLTMATGTKNHSLADCTRRARSGSSATATAMEPPADIQPTRSCQLHVPLLPSPAKSRPLPQRKAQVGSLRLPPAAAVIQPEEDPFDFMLREGVSSDNEQAVSGPALDREYSSQPEPLFEFKPARQQSRSTVAGTGSARLRSDRPASSIRAAGRPSSRKRSSSLSERLGSSRLSHSQPESEEFATAPFQPIKPKQQRHAIGSIKRSLSSTDLPFRSKASCTESSSEPQLLTRRTESQQQMVGSDCLAPDQPQLQHRPAKQTDETIHPPKRLSIRRASSSRLEEAAPLLQDQSASARATYTAVISKVLGGQPSVTGRQSAEGSVLQAPGKKRPSGFGFGALSGSTARGSGGSNGRSSGAASSSQLPPPKPVRAISLAEVPFV